MHLAVDGPCLGFRQRKPGGDFCNTSGNNIGKVDNRRTAAPALHPDGSIPAGHVEYPGCAQISGGQGSARATEIGRADLIELGQVDEIAGVVHHEGQACCRCAGADVLLGGKNRGHGAVEVATYEQHGMHRIGAGIQFFKTIGCALAVGRVWHQTRAGTISYFPQHRDLGGRKTGTGTGILHHAEFGQCAGVLAGAAADEQ